MKQGIFFTLAFISLVFWTAAVTSCVKTSFTQKVAPRELCDLHITLRTKHPSYYNRPVSLTVLDADRVMGSYGSFNFKKITIRLYPGKYLVCAFYTPGFNHGYAATKEMEWFPVEIDKKVNEVVIDINETHKVYFTKL